MENVIWYNLNENEFITNRDNKYLIQGPGIYAYKFKLDEKKKTIDKLKSRAKGVITSIHNEFNNLVKEFKTIKDAANFSPSNVSKYIKSTVFNNTY